MTETATVSVPMVDLKAQYARIGAEVDAAVARVMAAGQFIGGEECRLLEEEFARYCVAAQACGVANGTDALTLAMKAFGVGPGDEVATVANTFIATGEAIFLNGARPVFVDVDPATFTMDPKKLEAALTPRTKLIVPVHLYGHPADMPAILDVAARRGLPVLEDAAQAHGAEVGGKRAGALGHAATWSFYPGKNLGAYGDAGMVTSNDAGFVARVRQLANHGGGANKYDNVVVGTNSRLDTLQAAILRVKLRHLDGWNARAPPARRGLPSRAGRRAGIVAPQERAAAVPPGTSTRSARRTATACRPGCARKGSPPPCITRAPSTCSRRWPRRAARRRDLPVSERLCGEVLSLPLYPELPLETVERIARPRALAQPGRLSCCTSACSSRARVDLTLVVPPTTRPSASAPRSTP
jgi:dTDP-4-amino-4,6-dideoxygalactose transaminase